MKRVVGPVAVAAALVLAAGCTNGGSSADGATTTNPKDRIGQIDVDPTSTTIDPHAGRDPQHALPLNTPEEVGHYVVKVTEVRPNATAEVLAAHGHYLQPQKGQYMLVTLETTYVGTAVEGTPRYDLGLTFQGADGSRYPTCRGPLAASGAPGLTTGQTGSYTMCLDVAPAAIPSGVIRVQAFSAPGEKDLAFFGLT